MDHLNSHMTIGGDHHRASLSASNSSGPGAGLREISLKLREITKNVG